MSARGSILKQEVATRILEAFPRSFLYNDGKEIRINGTENGEKLQIKVTLTCAKVAVEGGEDTILPGENVKTTSSVQTVTASEQVPQEPTNEEKERLKTLLNQLGM